MFFFLFIIGDIRIRSQIHTSDWWIQIQMQEAQKHVDPVDPDSDPDLQQWLKTWY